METFYMSLVVLLSMSGLGGDSCIVLSPVQRNAAPMLHIGGVVWIGE